VRAAADLAAPDLVDVGTMAVLRKRWIAGSMTDGRFAAAVEDLGALEVDRYPALRFLRRVFELRANVTAYGAVYVALAEAPGCELWTADRRLARPGTCLPLSGPDMTAARRCSGLGARARAGRGGVRGSAR
jgi:predicted nucleic acid-binding protein